MWCTPAPTIKDVGGFVGNFTTALVKGGEEASVDHGVAIVATGGSELKPTNTCTDRMNAC